jgi:peptidylprolyl isomerase
VKYPFLTLLMAVSATAVFAQNQTTPAPATTAPATKPAATAAPTAPATPPATTAVAPPKPIPAADVPAQPANIKCSKYDSCFFIPPPGIPPAEGTLKTAFTLRYQDIKVGTGDTAEPGKQYIFHYTAWLAADGKQFDTSYDHRSKIMDKNQKPVKDANGKDELGPPQPLTITQGAQGIEHALTGLDQGFEGMRVGGKRRIIIPYQLAFGARERPSPGPDLPVGIPPKSDLIFDVELLAVNDPPEKHKHSMGAPPHPPTTPGAPAKPAQTAPPAPATTAQPK